MNNGYVSENDEQLGAFVRPSGCSLYPYWYVRHNGEPMRTFQATNNCSGAYDGGRLLHDNYNYQSNYNRKFGIVIRRTNLTSDSSWRIEYINQVQLVPHRCDQYPGLRVPHARRTPHAARRTPRAAGDWPAACR